MKKIIITITFTCFVLLAGCDERRDHPIDDYDSYAPFPPVGIRTVSLDNAVELRWIENQESDLAGYNIYVSNSYNGRYERIGTSSDALFTDRGARNGYTYYYAVAAYDYSGNESDLSKDVIYDTPRPEGYNVRLNDRFRTPANAGYDFSEYRIVHYDTDLTDLYVEFTTNGIPYFVVWTDTDIQDMGYTSDLDEISAAPTKGWAPTRDAQIIPGHTYVVHTWDNHYAKVRVTEVQGGTVRLDWAYQTAKGNTELIAPRSLGKKVRGNRHAH